MPGQDFVEVVHMMALIAPETAELVVM